MAKINALKLILNLGKATSLIAQIAAVAEVADEMNHAARADGTVTPEEDAQIALAIWEMTAPILSQSRALIRDLRS